MADLELSIKLFASVRDALGRDTLDVRLGPAATVGDLLDLLAAEHGEIAARRGSLGVAVNHALAPADRALAPGDEVALIPPVGGG